MKDVESPERSNFTLYGILALVALVAGALGFNWWESFNDPINRAKRVAAERKAERFSMTDNVPSDTVGNIAKTPNLSPKVMANMDAATKTLWLTRATDELRADLDPPSGRTPYDWYVDRPTFRIDEVSESSVTASGTLVKTPQGGGREDRAFSIRLVPATGVRLPEPFETDVSLQVQWLNGKPSDLKRR